MGELACRKIFKVFNQEFVVDERYTVTKELGQGAYGIVWSVTTRPHCAPTLFATEGKLFHAHKAKMDTSCSRLTQSLQCRNEFSDR